MSSAPLRPQSLMLTFLGDEVLGRGVCVYTGSVIEVFERAGVGEQATRSTLTRMAGRGLLRRERAGRRTYVGLTARSEAILRDGERRIWKTGAVNRDWDGTWTLLGFSLPESWQRQRHDLRSQLAWAGFGPLFNGLWIAPGEVEVSGIVAELGLAAHVKVFRARADDGTDVAEMIHETWDLPGLAARYRDFAESWRPAASGGAAPGGEDALALRLRLTAEWLQIIRGDPRLPLRHLPTDWPAARAEETFRAVHALLDAPARAAARRLIETIPATA
ncbi:PaaX family transcriptional regulator C-terminal domain-containing protein [Streptomyces sp. Li-HN-5-11]|uniref:PaaX family transcriptional regulator n=1 Tax=Streptomyces sp. Li-HN-5-11 TaxID=3075432 RepID=UPI0028AE042C|nr:PaaX family transcriptional regulator C-terminal domain-containing protein [Streptomyces sp. Li-HN-5-11]WNM33208.1 PaaX family transcriptional regulator C-terminal domain-containing protein [Streptomyces sp. Li-HN-5-11]